MGTPDISSKKTIVARHAAGETYAEIATAMRLSPQRIGQIVRNNSPDTKQGGRAVQRHQRLQTLLNQVYPLMLTGLTKAALIEQGVKLEDLGWLIGQRQSVRKEWKDAQTLATYGMSIADLTGIASRYGKTWQQFMMLYQASRKNALNRGAVWNLQLCDWIKIWEESGVWRKLNFNRKPRHGMILVDADLPYQLGNIVILTQSEISTSTRNRYWAARKVEAV